MRGRLVWVIAIFVIAGGLGAVVWSRVVPRLTSPAVSPSGRGEAGHLRLHFPSVAELTVGENRLVFGFTDWGGRPLGEKDIGEVSIVVSEVIGAEPKAVQGVPAHFLRSGWREVSKASYYENPHPLAEGFYKSVVRFPRAGQWGLEFVGHRPGKGRFSQRVTPTLLSESLTPPVGAPAPRSANPTLQGVGGDLTRLDSDPRLNDVEMHRESIAEVIKAGRPAAVLFASPGLDETRLSLPIAEILYSLHPKYGDSVAFIHVEIYDLQRYRRHLVEGRQEDPPPRPETSRTGQEWGVQYPPWLFLVDRRGRIVAKFFGPFARNEVEESLQRLVAHDAEGSGRP